MENKVKPLSDELERIASGEMYSEKILERSIQRLQELSLQPEDSHPLLDKARIRDALIHCRLGIHGVSDVHHHLADAALVIRAGEERDANLANKSNLRLSSDYEPAFVSQLEGLHSMTNAINEILRPEERSAEFQPEKLKEYGDDVGLNFDDVQSRDDGTRQANFSRKLDDGSSHQVSIEMSKDFSLTLNSAIVRGDEVLAQADPVPRTSVLSGLDRAMESFDSLAAQVGAEKTDVYNVSVTYEILTAESIENGDAESRGFDIEREEMDWDDLKRLIQDKGFSEPSSSHLDERMWFSTSSPEESRAHFEEGEDKYYSLHLNSVNGAPPTLDDMADIARAAGINVGGLENAGSRLKIEEDFEEPHP